MQMPENAEQPDGLEEENRDDEEDPGDVDCDDDEEEPPAFVLLPRPPTTTASRASVAPAARPQHQPAAGDTVDAVQGPYSVDCGSNEADGEDEDAEGLDDDMPRFMFAPPPAAAPAPLAARQPYDQEIAAPSFQQTAQQLQGAPFQLQRSNPALNQSLLQQRMHQQHQRLPAQPHQESSAPAFTIAVPQQAAQTPPQMPSPRLQIQSTAGRTPGKRRLSGSQAGVGRAATPWESAAPALSLADQVAPPPQPHPGQDVDRCEDEEDGDGDDEEVYGAGDSQMPQFNLLPQRAPTVPPVLPAASSQPVSVVAQGPGQLQGCPSQPQGPQHTSAHPAPPVLPAASGHQPQEPQPPPTSALARLRALLPKPSTTQGAPQRPQGHTHQPDAVLLPPPAAQAPGVQTSSPPAATFGAVTSPGLVLPPYRGATAVHNPARSKVQAAQGAVLAPSNGTGLASGAGLHNELQLQQGTAALQAPLSKDLSNHIPVTRHSTSPPSNGHGVQGATVPEDAAHPPGKLWRRVGSAPAQEQLPSGSGAADDIVRGPLSERMRSAGQAGGGEAAPQDDNGDQVSMRVPPFQDKPVAGQPPPAGNTPSPALSLRALLLPQPRFTLGQAHDAVNRSRPDAGFTAPAAATAAAMHTSTAGTGVTRGGNSMQRAAPLSTAALLAKLKSRRSMGAAAAEPPGVQDPQPPPEPGLLVSAASAQQASMQGGQGPGWYPLAQGQHHQHHQQQQHQHHQRHQQQQHQHHQRHQQQQEHQQESDAPWSQNHPQAGPQEQHMGPSAERRHQQYHQQGLGQAELHLQPQCLAQEPQTMAQPAAEGGNGLTTRPQPGGTRDVAGPSDPGPSRSRGRSQSMATKSTAGPSKSAAGKETGKAAAVKETGKPNKGLISGYLKQASSSAAPAQKAPSNAAPTQKAKQVVTISLLDSSDEEGEGDKQKHVHTSTGAAAQEQTAVSLPPPQQQQQQQQHYAHAPPMDQRQAPPVQQQQQQHLYAQAPPPAAHEQRVMPRVYLASSSDDEVEVEGVVTNSMAQRRAQAAAGRNPLRSARSTPLNPASAGGATALGSTRQQGAGGDGVQLQGNAEQAAPSSKEKQRGGGLFGILGGWRPQPAAGAAAPPNLPQAAPDQGQHEGRRGAATAAAGGSRGQQAGPSNVHQPDGQQADDEGQQRPWWYLLDDFVPVEALADGRDPRDGAPVHVLYSQQFTANAAAAHQALQARTPARARIPAPPGAWQPGPGAGAHNGANGNNSNNGWQGRGGPSGAAAGGNGYDDGDDNDGYGFNEDELLAEGGWSRGKGASARGRGGGGSGGRKRGASAAGAGSSGEGGGRWVTEAGVRTFIDARGNKLHGSAAYRAYSSGKKGGTKRRRRTKGARRSRKSARGGDEGDAGGAEGAGGSRKRKRASKGAGGGRAKGGKKADKPWMALLRGK